MREGFWAPLVEPRAAGGSLLIHIGLLVALALLGNLATMVAPRGGGAWGRSPVRAEVEPPANKQIVAIEQEAGDPGEPGPAGGDGEPGGAGEPGGRAGRGNGPGGDGSGGGGGGTTFFQTAETARSIVYVIDQSGSMGERRRLANAKAELLSSVARLSEGARFAVIFYNHEMEPFEGTTTPAWLDATPANRARLAAWLERVDARGGTRPLPVLEAALLLHSEAVYFVTDGQELSAGEVEILAATARSGATRIHAIDLGATSGQGPDAPLRRLAESTGGSYRQVGR